MPDVVIGGDASGAIAAVAAAQGAIDSLTGKTVYNDVVTRGMDSATRGMSDFGTAAGRAESSSRGLGDNLGRASDHVSRMADDGQRLRDHLGAVDNIMRGGAPSSTERSATAMRGLADNADSARQSIGGIGAESNRSLGTTETGAIRAGGGMRQLAAGSGSASQFMAGVSGAAQQVSRDLVPMAQGADGVYRSVSRLGESGKTLERFASAGGGFSGNSLLKDMLGSLGAMDGLAGKAGSAVSSMDGFGIAGAAVKGFGIAAGISAIGMGALGAAVAGVGIAGVAGDFAHNSQLMNEGQDAIRGFNKEFGKMRSETTASGMPAMEGLSTSIKGVGHELARIGADNMGSTLQHASELAGSTSTALKQLAPAVGPAEQALTSLGGAVVGALGQSAPAIASFANAVTQNSAGIQSGLVSTVSLMSNLGVMTAQALGTAAPLIQGASDVAGFAADFVSGGVRQQSNRMGDPNASGAGVDTGIPDGLGGTIKSPGASIGNKIGGALGAGAAGAGLGAAIGFAAAGPPGALLAGTVMGVGSAIAGWNHAGDPETALGPQAQTSSGFGPPQSQKSMGISSRPGRFGNFGPGSGGPAVPAGPTGAEIYDQQYTAATGAPSGAPHYSGVGPRGPGQSVGPMPASIAPSLGMGTIAPLNAMQSALSQQVSGGGAGLGQGITQHIQKAVHQAAPAAEAGGASLGGAMTGGMAQGITSTQTVTDTVMIKHLKKVLDMASGPSGIDAHSPSRKYDALGRLIPQGLAQGIEADSSHLGAVAGTFGRMNAMGYDYQDGGPPSISFNPRNPAMAQPGKDEDPGQVAADWRKAQGTRQGQFQPGSNAWWAAHDNRAAELAAGRAQRRQIARANIGAIDPSTGQRAVDPRRAAAGATVNPFQAGSAGLDPVRREAFKGLNPLSQLSAMFNQHGEAMTQGVGDGIKKGTPGAQNQMSQFSRGMQNRHKKDHGISSPSTVFAADGMNMAAGVGVGVTAGTSIAVGAVGGMASAMQAAGNDRMLMVGYTYGENVLTGAEQVLKKSDYASAGLPAQLKDSPAMAALAGTGLLKAGSGASIWKTVGNSPSTVTLPPASSTPQTITFVHKIDISGQMHEIATQVSLDHVGRMTDAISVSPR